MKRREPGTTKEVVFILIEQTGGLKCAAFVLDMGHSRVAEFGDPQADAQISYDRVRRLTRAGATAAAEDLAALAGGVFLPMAPLPRCPRAAMARSATEYAELVGAVMTGAATADQVKELDDVIRALAEMRVALTSAAPKAAGGV